MVWGLAYKEVQRGAALGRGGLCAAAYMWPTPMRAKKAEDVLRGQRLGGEILEKAAQIASKESLPIDDLRGEADYRTKMVETLVKEGLERAIA